MPLEQLNKAIKQLEFLQSLPNPNKVIVAITDSLGRDFVIAVYSEAYLTQITLIHSDNYWSKCSFSETYKYKQGNSANHKTIALMNVLIEARNHYELSTK